ncbi:MAG: restriction endonuclease subunit S [Nitrospira sp.]
MKLVKADEQWLDTVPTDWLPSRIRNVARLSPDYSSGAPTPQELCTVVPMELLSDDGKLDTSLSIPFSDVDGGLTLFEVGDVLFAKITPCMENGKGALVDALTTRYAFGSTEFHVLRPTHTVHPRFLYYYTFNPVYRAYAEKNMAGAAGQKRVPSRFLMDTRLFLPPLSEQQRIAAYLDESCAAIDAAVAAKRRQIETLEGLKKDLIQKAVTRGLDEKRHLRRTNNSWLAEVPDEWELVSLKRISEIQTGLTLGKVYEGPLIERPYLRVANVQDGHLNLDDVTTIEVPAEVAGRVELRAGDVLMTEGGDLDKLGRGTIWSTEIADCLHQNHIFAIRCFRHKLLPAFLAYLTASQYGRDYFEATGKRTTNLASTNSTKVGLFPIPRPSVEEQDEICSFLDDKLGEIGRISSGIKSQIDILTSYRKSLIHECVTGQRRITETATSNMMLP